MSRIERQGSSVLSKIIFSARSVTLDLMYWNEWKYLEKLLVLCKLSEETIEHFMLCQSYGKGAWENGWKLIYENDQEIQFETALEIRRKKQAT